MAHFDDTVDSGRKEGVLCARVADLRYNTMGLAAVLCIREGVYTPKRRSEARNICDEECKRTNHTLQFNLLTQQSFGRTIVAA